MPLHLEQCNFLLTYKCIAKCRHCRYLASPNRKGVMTVKDFQAYMTVLASEQSLRWIVFRGGEPFLFYKTLKRCIEIAHRLGQKKIAVVTSGHWGGNQTNAQKKLLELKTAGLSSIWFSVDAFHQEFVPFHSVHTAINAARTIGFDEIVITSQFLGTVNARNTFNSRTEECLERLRLPEDFTIVRNPIVLEGRASHQLARYLNSKPASLHGKCVLPSWAGETLKDPRTIEIDFEGNVSICLGLCIGNAKTESLSEIIRNYDYTKHPIMRLLAENGPHKLTELANTTRNFNLREFVNECHMCYELRKQLRGCYPESLAPQSCYAE